MRKKFHMIVVASMVLSSMAYAQYSQEIVFKTAREAPVDFHGWTFFWSMPVIEEGAKLDYVVIQPDGKEYFQYDISSRPAGHSIRSDFSPGFAGGDPSVFYGKQIVFQFRVTKGTMKFFPNQSFRFEFRKETKVKGVASVPDSVLYVDVDENSPTQLVSSSGWGQKANSRIAKHYSKKWLSEFKSPPLFLKTGFALYDAKRYTEALEVFQKMHDSTPENPFYSAVALIWKGHMLDLMDKRDAAVAVYKIVADMKVSGSMQHSQYRMTYSPSSYAAQRIKAPFVRAENKDK